MVDVFALTGALGWISHSKNYAIIKDTPLPRFMPSGNVRPDMITLVAEEYPKALCGALKAQAQ